MIKTDKGLVQIEGLSVEIMADFRVICRALRKTFAEEFGEDQGKEIFDALLVDDLDELQKQFWNISRKSRMKRNLMKKNRQQVIQC